MWYLVGLRVHQPFDPFDIGWTKGSFQRKGSFSEFERLLSGFDFLHFSLFLKAPLRKAPGMTQHKSHSDLL